MTLMSSISKLTTSVDQLTAEVNVSKATLDAKVAQAAAEVVSAQAEQALAEGYRDTTATHAADAATHLATVKAGVTYQGIAAILASKAVTAVDVFVYDTSLDSDGGAWRKRCQHTSWYNEALNTAERGSRRDFPSVAVIVAEERKVTIYDGDDPSLPMWMAISAVTSHGRIISTGNYGYVSSVSAKNGTIIAGTGLNGTTENISAQGLFLLEFPADRCRQYNPGGLQVWPFPLAIRNSGGSEYYSAPNDASGAILSYVMTDVDMVVMGDAKNDPATGLPIPTIAIATDGGISVIKNNGTVVDLVNYVSAPSRVSFVEVGGEAKIFTTSRYNNWVGLFDIPDADFNTGNYLWGFQNGGAVTWFGQRFADTDESLVIGANNGLVLFNKDKRLTNLNGASTGNRWQQMAAVLANGYTTGWIVGDIKTALLASTDTASLVASGELVTNGDFATNDLTGWTDQSIGTGSVSAATGAAVITATDASNLGKLAQVLTTVSGAYYTISFDLSGPNQAYIYVTGWASANFAAGSHSITFKANTTATTVTIQVTGNNGTVTADNISVRRADADRSVNNKGLIVNGTITRSPVATGAELVAYSGFSAANYLEQPYNSALDFGTGDFCVMGWVKTAAADTGSFFSRGDTAFSGARWWFGQLSGVPYVYSSLGSITATGTIPVGSWSHVAFLRLAGVSYFYTNGVLVHSAANTQNLTNTAAVTRLGQTYSSGNAFTGSLALWRISATAPTAEQIAKIYADERKLFQPGAQCTLYGTSDGVTALAHDHKTNLLHVGTSAGRSTFDGLVRVANTTTPVATAISAVNGLIAEQ